MYAYNRKYTRLKIKKKASFRN